MSHRFQKQISISTLVSLIFLLSGCSQIDQKPSSVLATNMPVLNKPMSKETLWEQRQANLRNKHTWQLGSKVSFRIDDENLLFGLNWQQFSSNNYEMKISNPITGALMSKLTRANSIVSLLADNGKSYRDNDEELLLKRQTSLSIPLKGMQHWVRGLTSPRYQVDKLVLDPTGRPLSLKQAGWDINYSSYVDSGKNALPKLIKLNRGAEKIFIRLVAKNWK